MEFGVCRVWGEEAGGFMACRLPTAVFLLEIWCYWGLGVRLDGGLGLSGLGLRGSDIPAL